MAKKVDTRALRQLAEGLVEKLIGEDGFAAETRGDLVTSLVRQWMTYEGNATLFHGSGQAGFRLDAGPFGKPRLIPEAVSSGWLDRVALDWGIPEDGVPGIIDQLNRGQSAEAITRDGVAVRLWVNPKERSRCIEPVVRTPKPEGAVRDLVLIAGNVLDQAIGSWLDPEERDLLVRSVAGQLRDHQGNALVLMPGEVVEINLEELEDGLCRYGYRRVQIDLAAGLRALGLPEGEETEAIARLNHGEEHRFESASGVPFRLFMDPKDKCVKTVSLVPSHARTFSGGGSLASFCPDCSAVLTPGGQIACHCCGRQLLSPAEAPNVT